MRGTLQGMKYRTDPYSEELAIQIYERVICPQYNIKIHSVLRWLQILQQPLTIKAQMNHPSSSSYALCVIYGSSNMLACIDYVRYKVSSE